MDATSRYPQWFFDHDHAPFRKCLALIPKAVMEDDNETKISMTITFGTETMDIVLPRGGVMARFPYFGPWLDGKDGFTVRFGVCSGELNLKLFNCSAPMPLRNFIEPLERTITIEHSVTNEAEHASSDERNIGMKMSLAKDPSLLTEEAVKSSQQEKGKGTTSKKYTAQRCVIRAQGDETTPSWMFTSIDGPITGSLMEENLATLVFNGAPFAARLEFDITHEDLHIQMVIGDRWEKETAQGASTTIRQLLKKHLHSLAKGCLASKMVCHG
jgi:hypothetical protein